MKRTLLYFSVLFAIISSCSSESETYVVGTTNDDSVFVYNNYNKEEVYIAMRDGTRLFTAIYAPKDNGSYPIIMYRTPYSVRPYGEENYKIDLGPNMRMTRDKYIFVYQDVRGQFMSEGTFENMTPHARVNETGIRINESTDTFDTIEWLLANTKNNNGKVGQWGISYPGFYVAAGMINTHPALVAVSPQAPIADWFFDDFHHHGAFFLPHTFNFVPNFSQPKQKLTKKWGPKFQFGTTDGFDFYSEMTPLYKAAQNHIGDSIEFWNQLIEHPNYDNFWQDRNILPHLSNVNCAVLTVGGWYDAEDLYGPLNIYQTVEKNNPNISNTIVMGPWSHGAWRRTKGDALGNVHFGSMTSEYYNNEVIYPFFTHHLKGTTELDLPEALMFETGTNKWRKFEEWPPKEVKNARLYLRAQHKLSFVPAKDNEYGMDIFMSDPNDPVPFTEDETVKMPKSYMTADQSFILDRKDILYYTTDLLEEDMTLAGPIEAKLLVKTDHSAADWIVKIIDVFPDDHPPFPHQLDKPMAGYHQMVRSEVIRGRFRNSYENPQAFEPKKETIVKVPLQDVLHTFKKGHRIMIQIQSTWFPIVDLNPQNYVENIYKAVEEDFVKANHFVSRSGVNPSYIKVGILEDPTL
jgi:putative CocE/NonD family hydrolase